MLRDRLDEVKVGGKILKGYLHRAPHRSFSSPELVSDVTNSPFVKNGGAQCTPLSILVFVVRAYMNGGVNNYSVITVEGDIYPVAYRKLSNKKYFKSITIYVNSKDDDQAVAWFVHDLKESR